MQLPFFFRSVMRGCDNMCTYCIVPFTRGKERSRPVDSILREIQKLSDEGVKEVTLLGKSISYLVMNNIHAYSFLFRLYHRVWVMYYENFHYRAMHISTLVLSTGLNKSFCIIRDQESSDCHETESISIA